MTINNKDCQVKFFGHGIDSSWSIVSSLLGSIVSFTDTPFVPKEKTQSLPKKHLYKPGQKAINIFFHLSKKFEPGRSEVKKSTI